MGTAARAPQHRPGTAGTASTRTAVAAPRRHAHPLHRLQQTRGNLAAQRLLHAPAPAPGLTSREPSRRRARGARGARPSASAVVPAVQRFAEGEHKAVGDVATGQRTIFLAPDMPVTYGDIVALGGDLFGEWSDIIRLARTPGITRGTRGEVWYAILVKVRANLEGRSEKEVEAEWLGRAFDQQAKAAVEARYAALAAENIPHFANPREGDTARSQALKSAGPTAIGAGATYRSNHATALMVAAAIGARHRVRPLSPGRLNDALLLEAFAGHFLTDAFAAGHQQTARASVRDYWDAKVPQFWTNFQQWLAARVTLELRRNPRTRESRIGAHLDPQWVVEQIALPSVRRAVASLPQLGFGDLMSGAIHDYFNRHGVQADVAGRRITLVGDSRLLSKAVRDSPDLNQRTRHVTDESRDTFSAMVAAVQAGIAEVHAAGEMGRAGEDPERVPATILDAAGGLFAAEQLLPAIAPDATVADPRQRSLSWKLASYLDVLSDPRLSEGLTISIGKYANQVGSLSGLSKEQMDAVMGVLIVRMKGGQASVVRLIREVIEYTPIRTDAGFNPYRLQDLGEFRRGISEGAFD